MPTDNDDTNDFMTSPLTRRDLEQVLDQRLANYPTKQELTDAIENGLKNGLENGLKNVATKDGLKNVATKDDLEQMHEQIVQENLANLRMVIEENRAWFRAIDDQYKDLPERVQKLEVAVFSPPPRVRRRKSS
jgi:hypothetical protein